MSRGKKLVDLAQAMSTQSESESESECSFYEDSDDSVMDKDYIPSSSGDSSSSDENQFEVSQDVLPLSQNNASQNAPGPSDITWVDITVPSSELFPTFCDNEISFNVPPDLSSPIDFLKLFVNDELIEKMVQETNRYAENLMSQENKPKSRLNLWKPVDHNELQNFFAIVIAMGIVNAPIMNLYWSKDSLYHNKFISSCMTRDRFLIILRCWHFMNNTDDTGEDRLFKIRHLIDSLTKTFKEAVVVPKKVVIDESMIPWRGRLRMKQYIKNKSHKYGVKLYKLCNTDGYVINFKIYSGKEDTDRTVSHAEFIVDSLLSDYYGYGRILYCDNFYTSYELAKYLKTKKTRICGTLRKNRKTVPKNIISQKLKRDQIAGKESEGIKIMKWVDKRPVLMLSTCENHEASLVDTGKIRKGQTVKKPQCVIDYNNAKKGVDYSDQMASYQSPLRKCLKWYKKIAVELIFNSAIVNAWVIFNHQHPTSKLTILQFREKLAKYFYQCGREELQPERPRTPKRYHTLTVGEPENKKRRKCVGCYQLLRRTMNSREADKKVKKVYTHCEECAGKPAYCLGCFNEAH